MLVAFKWFYSYQMDILVSMEKAISLQGFFILCSIIFKPIEKPIAKYILLLIVLAFWLYANKVEFSHRYACWSTYSEEEININVLYKSIIPCVICIFSFYMGIYYFEKRKKQDTRN